MVELETLNAVSSEAAKADALVDHECHNCQKLEFKMQGSSLLVLQAKTHRHSGDR
jgi:hypothetical protein